MGLNKKSKLKFNPISIFPELPCSILSVLIYQRCQSDIRVKSFGRLNLPRDSLFNFERLHILLASIEHPIQNLWPSKIWQGLLFSISSYQAYFEPQLDIRVKCYGCLNSLGASLFNFEHLDILWASIENPSQKLWPTEYFRGFHSEFQMSRYIICLNWTSK